MATNKRKDAAALFELIDKSTLKVPKSGGSLKIPSWWASRSNPQPADPQKTAPAVPPPSSQPKIRATPTASAPSPAPADAAPQSRLFEPPSAATRPGTSPTIRPPGASIRPPVSPTVKAPVTAPSKPTTPEIDTSAPTAPAAPGPAAAPLPPSAARNPWSPPKPGAFARLPGWVIVSMIAGIILVLCLLGLIVQAHHHPNTSPNPATSAAPHDAASANPGKSTSILPPSMSDTPRVPAPKPSPNNAAPPSPAPAETAGHFTGPGTVDRNTPAIIQRSGEQYYIIIASSPSEDVARRNGEFLAEHGVDASMETQIIEKKTWYVLVSAQGFSSYDAAEPFRKKIVQIGHELPAYKKTRDGRQAYDTARITNKVQTAVQTPPRG